VTETSHVERSVGERWIRPWGQRHALIELASDDSGDFERLLGTVSDRQVFVDHLAARRGRGELAGKGER
jgi:hypothetical protein